jgi:hypothetical protein
VQALMSSSAHQGTAKPMLLGWRLWRALAHQYTFNVIAQQQMKPRPPSRWLKKATRVFIALMAMGIIFFIFANTKGFSILGIMQSLVFIIIGFVLGLVLVYFVIGGFFLGIAHSATIAYAIGDQTDQRSLDLLNVTPLGTFGVCWSIARGLIQARGWFNEQASAHNVFQFIAGFVLFVVLGSFTRFPSPIPLESIQAFLVVATLIVVSFAAAIFIDFRFSIVSSILIGILAPTYANRREDAQTFAIIFFSAMQIAIYTISAIFYFVVAPTALSFLSSDVAYVIIIPISTSVLFIALREGAIQWLWHTMLQRLETTPAEAASTLTNL